MNFPNQRAEHPGKPDCRRLFPFCHDLIRDFFLNDDFPLTRAALKT